MDATSSTLHGNDGHGRWYRARRLHGRDGARKRFERTSSIGEAQPRLDLRRARSVYRTLRTRITDDSRRCWKCFGTGAPLFSRARVLAPRDGCHGSFTPRARARSLRLRGCHRREPWDTLHRQYGGRGARTTARGLLVLPERRSHGDTLGRRRPRFSCRDDARRGHIVVSPHRPFPPP